MAALGRWRLPVLVAGGVLSVLTGGSGMTPNPPVSAQPTQVEPLPKLIAVPAKLPAPVAQLHQMPVPSAPSVEPVTPGNFLVGIPVAQPGTPKLPAIPPPTDLFFPSAPGTLIPIPPAASPVAPQLHADPEITEPMATVHRFAGTYLGGTGRHLLVYAETADGKAEVRRQPLTRPIPDPEADADGNDEVKRTAVPAGKVTRHDRLAFVTAARELVAIGADGDIEWRFVLPGKADNGEALLDVVGFHDGRVFVASQQTVRTEKANALGRVYTFEMVSGRLVAFKTVAGGFDADARLALDGPNGRLFSLGGTRVIAHALNSNVSDWRAEMHAVPITHATGKSWAVCATTPKGVSYASPRGAPMLVPNVAGTAPPAMNIGTPGENARIYAPIQSPTGRYSLAAVDSWNPSPAWTLNVPKAIAVAPVLHGRSVYFLSGSVLYRINADSGAICWKHTLPLALGETLTELAFIGREIRASGPGVFVRVTERPEPEAPAP